MMFQCWASAADGGPTLKQHWVNASWLLGTQNVSLVPLVFSTGAISRYLSNIEQAFVQLPASRGCTCVLCKTQQPNVGSEMGQCLVGLLINAVNILFIWHCPVSTNHLYNICIMLVQRQIHWAGVVQNVIQMFCVCRVVFSYMLNNKSTALSLYGHSKR